MDSGSSSKVRGQQNGKAAAGVARNVLVVMDFYIRAVHEGIVRYAKEAGWSLDATLIYSHRLPQGWQGDGVLAQVGRAETAQALRKLRCPTVGMANTPMGLACPVVGMDDAAAGRLAAQHLLSRGFKRFVFYQPMSPSDVVDHRRDGFEQEVRAAGGEFHLLNWGDTPKRDQNKGRLQWLADKLRELTKPLGLMASSDPWATEAIYACRMAGLEVPAQVAVVGVDNDPLYVEVAPVPLSSVDNNLAAVGYEAAAMLDGVLSGRKPGAAKTLILPLGVVTRRSSDTLAVEDPQVARAAAFIYAHYREPIRMRDVADQTSISLRLLQMKFKKLVGRSPLQEILRLRLEYACKLLRETSLRIHEVAVRSGSSNGKYFGKFFYKHTGKSPKQYRKEHRGGD